MQGRLFNARQPLAVSYGGGVDSTAMLIEFAAQGITPDLILFADTGDEKSETYEYIGYFSKWLRRKGLPPITTVRYEVGNFKHWPPYHSLLENCLTNGTLPSPAFGGIHSCSQKWKIAPQDKYVNAWQPAIDCWLSGKKVRKAIGYDASVRDQARASRYAVKYGGSDEKYEYWYPLIDWGWDRDACIARIKRQRLRVPVKSACFY